MTNEIKDYLRSNIQSKSKGSVYRLILQFYSRARARRIFASLLLMGIPSTILVGIELVMNVGRLAVRDNEYVLRSRTALIEQTTKGME